MSNSAPLVLIEERDAVLTVRLNRPHVLNAFTDALLDAITEALTRARTDDAVRAVVITGVGRAFCAGQDLTAVDDSGNLDVGEHLRNHYVPMIRAIQDADVPVIAAVNGVAAGAGLSLALACDLRVAAESATFIQAFVRIGLVPDAGGTYFLPRLIGIARANEMAMLGDAVTAQRALDWGLVNEVVADGAIEVAAHDLAARLARGPRSVGMIKSLLRGSLDNDLETQLDREERAQVAAAATDDFIEGVSAFATKRPAQFSGR